MVAIPRDPPAEVAGLRTLGTGAQEAAPGDDSRFPPSGPLTIKVSYLGTPLATVFYQSEDVAGNIITARTSAGVYESPSIPGLFFYDQVASVDQVVAKWDEGDPTNYSVEVVPTRHVVRLPDAPTAVTAVGGYQSATVSFTPGDNGGSAILSYTVTAIDSTTPANGGQTVDGARSPMIVTGLTNGDHYTFTVVAHTAIGDSPASAASNMVIPAVVLYPPEAPTNIQATVTGSGQVTVTFDTPYDGGSPITSYLVSAVDETNSAHNTTHAGASPNVVTGLVNGETYHFTVHAVNAIGTGAESVASNSVTPSGSGGIATFTATQVGSTLLLLDSAGSTGTLTWEVDGVASPTHTATLLIGPLTVGTHHVKLTAVSGGAGITERDIAVAWVAKPLGKAQTDTSNGSGSTGVWGVPFGLHPSTLLPKWADQPVLAPWRNYEVYNMVEGYPGAGDGVERLTIYDDDHIALLCKDGDRIGSSGGYRSAMAFYGTAYMQGKTYVSATTYAIGAQVLSGGKIYTSLQNANQGNTPATSPTWWQLYSEYAIAQIQLCGQNIQTASNNFIDGHSTDVRFYRFSFKLPTGTPNPLLYMNNMFELFGVSDGAVAWMTNGTGTQVGWNARSKINGNPGPPTYFDLANIQINVWYDYVVEICWNTNPAIGYIRVYRDYGGGAGMVVLPLALCPIGTVTTPGANYGKFFYATQQTDGTGKATPVAVELENYRDRTGMGDYYTSHGNTSYPDVTVEYANGRIGPTLASVMAI